MSCVAIVAATGLPRLGPAIEEELTELFQGSTQCCIKAKSYVHTTASGCQFTKITGITLSDKLFKKS